MQKSLEDKARSANNEMKNKIDESIEKGIYAFRAQTLHYNNTELLKEGKFDAVIANTDLITGIINREQALILMDDIQTLLANNKNFIKAATENLVDVTSVKERVLGIEAELHDGNMYKAKRELTETLEDMADVRRDHLIGWSRYTIIELNEKMDEILEKYKEFPKQFFHFQENPVHILTSFLEDIMSATRDEKYENLEELVDKFYHFYFQIERFLREEHKIREANGGELPPEIPQIKPMEETPEDSSPESHHTQPEERIKDLFAELDEINEVSEEGPDDEEAEEEGSEDEEAEEEGSDDEEEDEVPDTQDDQDAPGYSLPEDIDDHAGLDEKPGTEEPKENIRSSFSTVSEVIDKLKDQEKSEEEPEKNEELEEKKIIRQEAREKSKIMTLVKTPKEIGKMLPAFKSPGEIEEHPEEEPLDRPAAIMEDDGSPASVESKTTDFEDEGCKVVDLVTGEEKEECQEEEVDEEIKLQQLAARAFKNYLNKDYDVAIEFYDQILAIDPEYKDAYEKRDECYMKIFKSMKNDYIKKNKPKKKGKKKKKSKKKKKKTKTD